MTPALRCAVEGALRARIERFEPLSGGDINDAFRVALTGGSVVFVKTNDRAVPDMFPAEARGLRWLAEARAIRVPEVLAVSSPTSGDPPFLALEYIEPSRKTALFDDDLGRALAALHRSGALGFGLDHDNFIGRLPQVNRPCASWAEFYRERRLLPQLKRAEDSGRASSRMKQGLEWLCARMDEWVGPPEPPARLHGDLWGGNLHVGDRGEPCLIDPAAYGGHREIDLAMMRLFGGFSERAFAAYREAHPLSPGYDERVPLYQLYPLLVHVNLFGTSYVGGVERALAGLT